MSIASVTTAGNGVTTIMIDRPPVNAVRFVDLEELDAVFAGLQQDPEIRCVILTAAGGRAFVPGTDIGELAALTRETAAASTLLVQRLVNRIYDFPAPVVCGVNGPALGSGVAIAASADIRIASENATFGLPEVDVGVLGGSKHLARFVPQGKARLMMYTGWRIDAAEAYRLGLVEAVVPLPELLPEVRRIADEIASKFPPAVRLAKRGLNVTESMPLKEGYAFECELTAELRDDPGSAEVSRRFLAARASR
jgi:enoyl-CoA hydratase